MATQDEIEDQKALLETHRQTLTIYLRQLAKTGTAHAPPGLMHGINEARENIRRIKAILRSWSVSIEDHPDDTSEVLADKVAPSHLQVRADIGTYFYGTASGHPIFDPDANLVVVTVANSGSAPAYIDGFCFRAIVDGEEKSFTLLNLNDPALDLANPKPNTPVESGRKLTYYFRLAALAQIWQYGLTITPTEVVAYDQLGNKHIGSLSDNLKNELQAYRPT